LREQLFCALIHNRFLGRKQRVETFVKIQKINILCSHDGSINFLVLEGYSEEHILYITINEITAQTIGSAIYEREKGWETLPTPTIHYVLRDIFEKCKIIFLNVIINDFVLVNYHDEILPAFKTVVSFTHNDISFCEEMKPSDAIALAHLHNTPIYVEEGVFQKYREYTQTEDLENLDPTEMDRA